MGNGGITSFSSDKDFDFDKPKNQNDLKLR